MATCSLATNSNARGKITTKKGEKNPHQGHYSKTTLCGYQLDGHCNKFCDTIDT